MRRRSCGQSVSSCGVNEAAAGGLRQRFRPIGQASRIGVDRALRPPPFALTDSDDPVGTGGMRACVVPLATPSDDDAATVPKASPSFAVEASPHTDKDCRVCSLKRCVCAGTEEGSGRLAAV